MTSLSFDGMVELYDETRVCDQSCLDAALGFLTEKFPPDAFSSVLEPGIGTGRIAIPLAERGYQVTGVDISGEMLVLLKKRLVQTTRPLPISCQQADVTNLPFPDATFDMVITAHLFYFIVEWRKAADEILRVVRRGCPIIIMHTGTGKEIPLLNKRYKGLSAELGCPIKDVGVKSTIQVVDHFRGLGCLIETVRDRWQWTARIRLAEAIAYMKARAYSFTTVAPEDVHTKIIGRLESETRQRFGNLETEIAVPNQIYLVLVTK